MYPSVLFLIFLLAIGAAWTIFGLLRLGNCLRHTRRRNRLCHLFGDSGIAIQRFDVKGAAAELDGEHALLSLRGLTEILIRASEEQHLLGRVDYEFRGIRDIKCLAHGVTEGLAFEFIELELIRFSYGKYGGRGRTLFTKPYTIVIVSQGPEVTSDHEFERLRDVSLKLGKHKSLSVARFRSGTEHFFVRREWFDGAEALCLVQDLIGLRREEANSSRCL